MRTLLASLLVWAAVGAGPAYAGGEETLLARDGEARLPVVVGPEAGEHTRAAAEDLAAYLERITGAPFEVTEGDGSEGVVVGVPDDFTALPFDLVFGDAPFERDHYTIRSTGDGLYLLGAAEQAAELAVWDFLHRQGYRLFFLTETWEVVPEKPELSVTLDVAAEPDYIARDAPRGAPWSNSALWDRWLTRNRAASSFDLDLAHVYGRIIRENADAFEANPEFYALVDGERRYAGRVDGGGDIKFCISNPELRDLVVDWAVETMEAQPERDSISMDPSDGANWCECEPCVEMGSVSDRALTLANEVAEAINELDLGPKYVGMYAYNRHSPPPNIEVHPNVIISIATSFIRGGYTIEELVEGWQAQGATLGMREYHDVFTWTHDLPREARGGDIAYLQETIPYFHEHGARFMNSENADSWGANGLGYWLTPRMLWDLDNAERVDALIEDFLDKAFGDAKEPMRAFYELLNQEQKPRSDEDVVGRMYRHLVEARARSDSEAVRERLADLILYTRYLELYHAYRGASDEARQAGFEDVWRHVYRMRDRFMVSTEAICVRDVFRDGEVSVPEEAAWDVPEEDNPWKSSEPFDEAEIEAILEGGIANNQVDEPDFEPVTYSGDLVPAAEHLDLREVEPGGIPLGFRGEHEMLTWVSDGEIQLEVTGGLIAHYRDRGNVRIGLYAKDGEEPERVAHDDSVPPDGEPREVVLESPRTGLHRLEWRDGEDRTHLDWPAGQPMTLKSTREAPAEPTGSWSLYFYVPKGTETVGGFATAAQGTVRDGGGAAVFDFSEMNGAGYFNIPVPEGQDRQLWKLENCNGGRGLSTVPPYLARDGSELLLPREVVEADTGE